MRPFAPTGPRARPPAAGTVTVALRAAPPAGGLPAYNVALAPGPLNGDARRAVIRATATGAALAVVGPPRPYRVFTWVSAAADDRTFALAAELVPAGAPPAARGATGYFRLRLDPRAGTARLSRLPIPALPDRPGMGSALSGIALSPSGGKLAIALGNGGRPGIRVFDLRTGSVRAWHGSPQARVEADELGANPLSWAADGRTLAFDVWHGSNIEVRLLDTGAPGGSLAASRLVKTFRNWPHTGSAAGSAVVTPDGTKIAVMSVPGAGSAAVIQANEYAVATGKLAAVLARLRYRAGAITGWPSVLWSSPSGSRLIVKVTRPQDRPSGNGGLTPEQIGTVAGGRFIPLPGRYAGEIPVW